MPILLILGAATIGAAIGFRNGLKVGGAVDDAGSKAGLGGALALAALAAGGGFVLAKRLGR